MTQEAEDGAAKRISYQEDLLTSVRSQTSELSLAQRQHKEQMLIFGTQLQEVQACVAACKTGAIASEARMEAVSQQSEDTCRKINRIDQQLANHADKVRTEVNELS